MSMAEEEVFLDSFKDKARSGGVLEVAAVHAGLEKILSRKVHLSVVYKLLHRHGWRKLAPRKRNAKTIPWLRRPEKSVSCLAQTAGCGDAADCGQRITAIRSGMPSKKKPPHGAAFLRLR